MPLCSMRSNNLGGSAVGPIRSLYLNGLDVRLKADSSTNRYGVPLDSIEVTEEGPNGVSSMTFTLEDPSSEITVNDGDSVYFHNHTTDLPVFRGWVQTWDTTVFGTGRAFGITCIGVEAVLDWLVVMLDMTFAISSSTADAIQALVANSTGIGVPLRAFSSTTNNGTQAAPLGDLGNNVSGNQGILAIAVTVTAGTSLREAIRQVCDATTDSGGTGVKALTDGRPRITVDYWFGLRGWLDTGGGNDMPTDYAGLTITDTTAGAIVAANLDHKTDALPHAVYVIGGNAAGSGFVTDGTGIVGPVAALNDSTILTAAARDTAAFAYLNDRAVKTRGEFDRETFTDTSTLAAHIQAGSIATITDAQVGLSSSVQRIASISKRFHGGGLETWHVNYGQLAPSLPREIRRLTRAIRS